MFLNNGLAFSPWRLYEKVLRLILRIKKGKNSGFLVRTCPFIEFFIK